MDIPCMAKRRLHQCQLHCFCSMIILKFKKKKKKAFPNPPLLNTMCVCAYKNTVLWKTQMGRSFIQNENNKQEIDFLVGCI